ncbi:Hypothetical protein CAP_4901 [Chondromyces apiculatus DSM 436]|uniref:Uncharacterized protein n=1 Tax=Chondromyces apiculatus DSM 436 TaxID=1192034 RepID=A0A017T4V4_9BACT|nr:Hypothetical protein CAP_4901 [Chondromyces apiculatus DSM 436]
MHADSPSARVARTSADSHALRRDGQRGVPSTAPGRRSVALGRRKW